MACFSEKLLVCHFVVLTNTHDCSQASRMESVYSRPARMSVRNGIIHQVHTLCILHLGRAVRYLFDQTRSEIRLSKEETFPKRMFTSLLLRSASWLKITVFLMSVLVPNLLQAFEYASDSLEQCLGEGTIIIMYTYHCRPGNTRLG